MHAWMYWYGGIDFSLVGCVLVLWLMCFIVVHHGVCFLAKGTFQVIIAARAPHLYQIHNSLRHQSIASYKDLCWLRWEEWVVGTGTFFLFLLLEQDSEFCKNA